MSTRTSLRPQVVINAGGMNKDLTSSPTILQSITGVGYGLYWSGTSPVGTVSVQVSNDYSINPDGTVNNSGTWSTVTLQVSGSFTTTVAVSGNTGNGFINLQELNAYAVRLIYTAGSGTGSLTVIFNGKTA